MDEGLAIIIYSVNKRWHLEKCIESILLSVDCNIKIYSIGMVYSKFDQEKLINKFQNHVRFLFEEEIVPREVAYNKIINKLQNEDNIQNYYGYIMLDSIMTVKQDTFQKVYNYFKSNDEVGIVGFKICDKDKTLTMGGNIDFENFRINLINKIGNKDIECNYINLIAIAIKNEVIKKIKAFDETYCNYFSDVDLCYRVSLEDYKIRILHNIILNTNNLKRNVIFNTANTYYYWRNRIRFFMTYTNIMQKKIFSKFIFNQIFDMIYECNYANKSYASRAIMDASVDAINGISGVISQDKIIQKKFNLNNKFEKFIIQNERIYLIGKDSNEDIIILNKISLINRDIRVSILSPNEDIYIKLFKDELNIIKCNNDNSLENEILIKICNGISELRGVVNERYMYVDTHFNFISQKEDYEYIRKYSCLRKFFENTMYSLISDGVQKNVYNNKDGKIKIIIFGTGSTAERIRNGLSNDTEILCYCDNNTEKWGKSFSSKRIVKPDEISSIDFHHIIIASQFNNEIYKQLLELKVEKNKIFDYFRYIETKSNYVINQLMQIKANSDVEIISTGISYMQAAIDSNFFDKKIISVANHSQDLYYDYNLIKYALEKYKNNLKRLKYVIIGLCYYSFQYDMSLSAMKTKVDLYREAIGLEHNLDKEKYIEIDLEINRIIGNTILGNKNNNIKNTPKKASEIRNLNYEIGKHQALIDSNKNYPNTVKENINILNEYLNLLKNNNIMPIVIVCPVSKYYSEYFPNAMREEFYDKIKEIKTRCDFVFYDYFNSNQFTDDDFGDVSHLNREGSIKFSQILNKKIIRITR